MIRKLARRGRDDEGGARQGGEAPAAPLFNLDELHERRILSWSPEPDDDGTDASPEPEAEVEVEEPAPATVRPAAPVRPAPPAALRTAPAPSRGPREERRAGPEAEDEDDEQPGRRRRGRPRGRPRRQVHFHVDPDEEVLLLAAVEKFGSQQKGLIAALQALHDIEIVRDEVERLAAECERQRKLLDQAESIFNR